MELTYRYIKSEDVVCPTISDSFIVDFDFLVKDLFLGNGFVKSISAFVPKLKNPNLLTPLETKLLFPIELNNNPTKDLILPSLSWESEANIKLLSSTQTTPIPCKIYNDAPITLTFDGRGIPVSYAGETLNLYIYMLVANA